MIFCSGYTYGSEASHGSHVDPALDPGLHLVGAELDQLHPGVKFKAFCTKKPDHFQP